MNNNDNLHLLRVSDLQELLRAKGLSISYRLKTDLIERLRSAQTRSISTAQGPNGEVVVFSDENLHNLDNSEVFEDPQNDEDQYEGNSGGNTTSNQDNTNEDSNSGGGNSSNGDDKDSDSNDDNSDHNNRRDNIDDNDEQVDNTMAINFRDVEDALQKFGGLPYEDLDDWCINFEETSETCKWSDMQKFVFARRLMIGEAKGAIEATKTKIDSYAALKAFLKLEYKDESTFFDIHERLVKRKKTSKETYIEYMYAMMKMGKAKIDDLSMVRYIVDGLHDDHRFKTTLYEAKTLEELKTKLKVFASTAAEREPDNDRSSKKSHNTKNRDKKQSNGGNNGNNKTKSLRCFNCGDANHKADECPHKGQGRKCFNCDAFGHLAKDCRCPKKTKDDKHAEGKGSTKAVGCIEPVGNGMIVPVTINSVVTMALFDTGSHYTLMAKSTYRSIPRLGKWIAKKEPMKGLSEADTYALGYKWVTMSINDESYQLQCYVVEDNLFPMKMILGRNLLPLVDVVITRGVPIITKIKSERHDLVNVQAEQSPSYSVLTENDIMMIEPAISKVETKYLPCVVNIQDVVLKQEIIAMIDDYQPVRGQSSHIKMQITMSDEIPVYQNPRRLSPMEREVAQSMVDQYIREGIVRPSRSPYASPILLRKKKNNTYRFCVDYRKLNDKIVKDRYPLPLMEDVIEALQDAEVFSSIDLKNGFFHVDMAEESIKYTAFITPDGQYEFLKAPFGLCNSPAIFQRFINDIFRDAMMKKVLRLYLDDIMVPAIDELTNLQRLKETFNIAANNGLIINFEKCQFLQRKITFLGNVIENHGIRPSDEKTKAIRDFPQPKTPKQIQSFLGLTGFFRKFIPRYAQIARPISDLLRDGTKFTFGTAQKAAFAELKEKLCSEPILKLYNPMAPTELHTDASALGYGGCLLQQQNDDGLMHPVYYLSFKTTVVEAKLHSYELEVLAIIKCLEKLRCYVLGRPFKIYTDCEAFQQTMRKRNATAKVARWALALEEYDVEVKHRSGNMMQHVDALSRNFVMVIEDSTFLQIKAAQQDDDECKLVHSLIEANSTSDYVRRDGVIYQCKDGYYRLKIPKAMAYSLLLKLHGDGHMSRRRMEVQANQEFQIDNLGKIIDKLIKNCVPCILATKKKGKKDGWLESIEKHDTPMHTYHIDHVGPIPSSHKGYQHILVVTDAFTKFNWLYPVKSTAAEEAITKLKQQALIFGNPSRIIADRGSSFRSTAFDDYCNDEKIQKHLITTGTPRGNGQVERMNGIIVPILTKLSITDPTKWYRFVDRVQICINTSVSRSTKSTPFKLMFGVEMKSKEDLQLNEVMSQALIDNFDVNRNDLRTMAKENIAVIQQENQRQFNKYRKIPTLYVLGDLVAIERTQMEKGLKVRPKMLGPYEVIKVNRNDRYQVRKVGMQEGPIQTSTSADKMKRWASDLSYTEDD